MTRGNRSPLLLIAALLASACSESPLIITNPPDDDEKETVELSFLRQDGIAPPLLTTDTTFVATRGQDLEVELFYAAPGGGRGEEFLEFELDDESLLTYPAGHPRAGQSFVDGDTISIRISIDPALLIATMEPAGLLFNPQEPAELEMRYLNADEDYDDDGEDDPPESEDRIDLWRQEMPSDPWERVGDIKDADLDRIRAFLTSFSRYALAI
ncbi:MAG: hypothetical protein OEU54_14000 [Gemmatimonadota bacterium]|nr:hypothetical protein [Gemmatimonadota bacterium]